MLIYRTRPFCCCLLIINMPLSMRNCLIGSNRHRLDCFTSFFVIVFRDLNLAELHGWENSPPCSGEADRRRGEDNESELVSDLLLIFLTSTTLTFFSSRFVCINTTQRHLPALSKKKPHCPLVQPSLITSMCHGHLCNLTRHLIPVELPSPHHQFSRPSITKQEYPVSPPHWY